MRLLSRLRNPWVGGVAAATVHYLLFWALFLVGFSLVMNGFDEGSSATAELGQRVSRVSELLAAPLAITILRSPSRNLPSWQQHAILGANSLLWGAGAAVVLWALGRAYSRTDHHARDSDRAGRSHG